MAAIAKTQKGHDPSTGTASPLFLSLEQAANRLGISPRTLFELREKSPLYAPNGMRNIDDNPKKPMWLWSEDLIQLIAFARTLGVQGVRLLSDQEAFAVRKGMEEKKRKEYLEFIEE